MKKDFPAGNKINIFGSRLSPNQSINSDEKAKS
jgi:hypothetical protein